MLDLGGPVGAGPRRERVVDGEDSRENAVVGASVGRGIEVPGRAVAPLGAVGEEEGAMDKAGGDDAGVDVAGTGRDSAGP